MIDQEQLIQFFLIILEIICDISYFLNNIWTIFLKALLFLVFFIFLFKGETRKGNLMTLKIDLIEYL